MHTRDQLVLVGGARARTTESDFTLLAQLVIARGAGKNGALGVVGSRGGAANGSTNAAYSRRCCTRLWLGGVFGAGG